MKDSFVFYSSYSEAILLLESAESQMRVLKALWNFAFNEQTPEEGSLSKTESIIFFMAKPTIEASKRNYEKGQSGGRPSVKSTELEKLIMQEREKGFTIPQIAKAHNVSERTVKYILASAKTSAKSAKTNDNDNDNDTVNLNDNDTVNLNDNDTVNLNDNENEKDLNNNCNNNSNYNLKKPTLEKITAFCEEKNLGINPREFFDYYEKKNWENVYNWQAMAIGWNNRQINAYNKPPKKGKKPDWKENLGEYSSLV